MEKSFLDIASTQKLDGNVCSSDQLKTLNGLAISFYITIIRCQYKAYQSKVYKINKRFSMKDQRLFLVHISSDLI